MGIADSMKDLSENIVASHNARVAMLGNLFADTHKTLKEFSGERTRMGRKQSKDLTNFVDGLSKEVGDMLTGSHKARTQMSKEQTKRLSNFMNDLEKNTANLLKHFSSGRQQMSDEQAKSLAGFVNDLTKNVQNMLKAFSSGRQQMSDEQASNLGGFVGNLHSSVETMVAGFFNERMTMSKDLKDRLSKDVSDIESYVEEKLNAFHKAHADMSKETKKSLSQYVKGISKGVRNLLHECESDMKASRASWNGMVAPGKAKAKTSKPLAEAKGKPKPVVEMQEKVITVEEAIEKHETKQPEPEEDLSAKIMSFINAHPGGARVVEMEESFGVARIKLALMAKKLLEEKRISKSENMYYPL
jgi:uncharacterized protein YicC (UPF0701 family)